MLPSTCNKEGSRDHDLFGYRKQIGQIQMFRSLVGIDDWQPESK